MGLIALWSSMVPERARYGMRRVEALSGLHNACVQQVE